ncbi:MAG: MFS transporter [Phycisphaerae bacterium]|nr:MFS transporter [Phycisphaerae bacterium]
MASSGRPRKVVILAVLVAALGYFVDLYDLVLFTAVWKPSLEALGVAPEKIAETGKLLLNLQLTGLMVGGITWGILGDKRGRLTVLFGSIVTYSLANLLNAFVTNVEVYAVLRFVAGFGLAGELGAGITLVSELLDTKRRGVGTTIVASVGLAGAIAAGLVSSALLSWDPLNGWRTAYGIGGAMGLLLLALRVGVLESGLFQNVKQVDVLRGDVRMLLWPPQRFARFALVILVGMPIWFAGGVLFVFSPLIGGHLGLDPAPTAAMTVMWAYIGVVLGDLCSGLLSQFVKRRKPVIALFLLLYAGAIWLLLSNGGRSLTAFYGLMCLVGATTGYWVLFVTVASEQFGTNLRSTVTTSAPNFVRGSAVIVTQIWFVAGGREASSSTTATMLVGFGCIAIGLLSLWMLDETFHRDLDYLER